MWLVFKGYFDLLLFFLNSLTLARDFKFCEVISDFFHNLPVLTAAFWETIFLFRARWFWYGIPTSFLKSAHITNLFDPQSCLLTFSLSTWSNSPQIPIFPYAHLSWLGNQLQLIWSRRCPRANPSYPRSRWNWFSYYSIQ